MKKQRITTLLVIILTATFVPNTKAGWIEPENLILDQSLFPVGYYDNIVHSLSQPYTLDATSGRINLISVAAPINTYEPYIAGADTDAQFSAYLDDSTGSATMYFNRPGVYPIEVWYQGQQQPERSILLVDVSILPNGNNQVKGPVTIVSPPDTQVVIVAEDDKATDDLSKYYVAKGHPNVQRCSCLKELSLIIDDAYKLNNNQPVTVTLGGHGQEENETEGKFFYCKDSYFSDNLPTVKLFIKENKGKISKLVFVSCRTGRDRQWLSWLAQQLGPNVTVGGFDESLLVTQSVLSSLWSTGLYLESAGSYYTVPEPATVLTLGFGGLVLLKRPKRQSILNTEKIKK